MVLRIEVSEKMHYLLGFRLQVMFYKSVSELLSGSHVLLDKPVGNKLEKWFTFQANPFSYLFSDRIVCNSAGMDYDQNEGRYI